MGIDSIVSREDIERVKFSCDKEIVISLLKWFDLCRAVDGGLQFPSLLPRELGVPRRLERHETTE